MTENGFWIAAGVVLFVTLLCVIGATYAEVRFRRGLAQRNIERRDRALAERIARVQPYTR
jgi:uncharacterized membrane protein